MNKKQIQNRECPADTDKVGYYEYSEDCTSGSYVIAITEAGKHLWEVRGLFQKYKRCRKCGIEEL